MHHPVLVTVVDALQDLLYAVGSVGLGVKLTGNNVLEELATGDSGRRMYYVVNDLIPGPFSYTIFYIGTYKQHGSFVVVCTHTPSKYTAAASRGGRAHTTCGDLQIKD